MSSIEKDIKQYIKAIKRNLFCDRKSKQQIISDIENSIYDFAENKGISDIKEIYDRFGTPYEVAKQYISQEYTKTVKRTTDKRKIIIVAVICTVLLSVISGLLIYYNYFWYDNSKNIIIKNEIYVENPSKYIEEQRSLDIEEYNKKRNNR